MTTQHLKVHSTSPEHTRKIATSLAPCLGPGDTLLLEGPSGAGKSHFARATILSLLAEPEEIPSPTYTLVQTYDTAETQIWHADLYRLTSTTEVEELGLMEAFETAICLVEWPDRLGNLRPRTALDLTFAHGAGENERQLTCTWSAATWDKRVQQWLS